MKFKITDSAASDTGTPDWYYDGSSPGTPQFSAYFNYSRFNTKLYIQFNCTTL